MVRVLLVDDEIHAVEGVKSAVDWERIGVSEVHTAYNVQDAKHVFARHSIDLLLCDIEMPQGSGLELLAWVKENHPTTESIFLTCHADFHYAKQAVQLGSFDYLLKPLPIPELEGVITRAIAKRDESSKKEEYSRYGQYWVQHQPLLIERFWLDILNRSIPTHPEAIRQAAEERNIPYSEHMQFVPVLIVVKRWHKELSMRDEKILEYAIRNSAEETLLTLGDYGQLLPIGQRALLAILSCDSLANEEMARLIHCCEGFIASSHNYFYCDLSCYVGDPAYPHDLPTMTDRLFMLDRDNVARDNLVIRLNGLSSVTSAYQTINSHVWTMLLKEGDAGKLAEEATESLEMLSRLGGLDAKKLHQFHQDFLQLVYAYLYSKGIQAHQLFGDDRSVEMSVSAARSVKDMTAWVRYVAMKATEYVISVEQSESVVDRVIAFVTKHIGTTLLREDIAKHVFLNPDYLDRVFKKEKGISVTEFVTRERMAVAQELLLKTSLPVNVVAAQVGYSNFSHFSRMFRKYSNKNPIEFRHEGASKPN